MGFSDEIMVRLGLDSASFNQGLEQAAKGGEMLKRALEMAGIGLSLNEAMEFFKTVGEYAEKIKDTAEATGLTAERVQGLQYAFRDAGIDADQTEKFISKLSIKIGEAANGSSEAQAAFSKWGVAIANTAGEVFDTSEVINNIADRMQSLGSATDRSAFANEMFGKGASSLIPILSEGKDGLAELDSKMRESSAFMTNDAVDAWDALGKVMKEAETTVITVAGNMIYWTAAIASSFGLLKDIGVNIQLAETRMAIREAIAENESKQRQIIASTKEQLELQRKIAEGEENLRAKKHKNFEDTLADDEKILALEQDIAELNEQGFESNKIEQLKIQSSILDKQAEIQRIKVKLQKEENDELEKYSNKLEKLHEDESAALAAQGDAQDKLNSAKADRSHLTINELANAQLAWNASADAANQQRTAQEIMRLEAAAQAARLSGDIGGAEGSLNAADALRAGLGMLKENERNQFKSLEEALKKQTDRLDRIHHAIESIEIVNTK